MLGNASRRLDLMIRRFSTAYRLRPHARSPFPMSHHRIDPPEGCGTIRITSKAIARAAEPRARKPKPGTPLPPKGSGHRLLGLDPRGPVVLVDGVPAAVGLGRGWIAVPAGRHLVQVQYRASGRYWPVKVEAGGEVRLASVVSRPYFSDVLHERMRRFFGHFSLGPKAFLRPYQNLSGTALATAATLALSLAVLGPDPRGLLAAVAVGLLVALAPWARWARYRLGGVPKARFEPVGGEITWRPVDPYDDAEPDPGSGATLRVNVVFLHEERREHRPVSVSRTPMPEVPVAARPIPGRKQDPDAPIVESLGEELEGIGRWAQTEWRMLVRDMGWDRERRERLAEARKRHSVGMDNATWIEPPRVTLDDRELPAVWGLNEYRLPARRFDLLEIAIPGPAPLLDKGTKVNLRERSRLLFELDLSDGSVTTIEGYSLIKSEQSADGQTLNEYSGRIWTAEPPRSHR